MKLVRLAVLVFAAVSITVSLRLWVLEPFYVASASMEPTFHVGERGLCDKITLRLRPLRRGDIVLFPPPTGEPVSVGKRVIALPGETIQLRAKAVFINGQELPEPYAVHRRAGIRLLNDDLGPLIVPEGAVFVLGDNRDESEDSTVWKNAAGQPIHFISSGTITGLARSWPL